MMKREAAVAVMIGCSLGCGAAEGAAPDGSAGGRTLDDALDDSVADGSQAPAEPRICDGSTAIRLAIGQSAGGMAYAYTSVLSELGIDFLYVDGACHYWVQEPSFRLDRYREWRPYREGVLTPTDEQRLHDAVNYDDVPADTCVHQAPPADAGARFFWDGRVDRRCPVDLYGPSVALRAELYDTATPVTGPMRIQAGQNYYGDARVVYEWPLATPIDPFVSDDGSMRSVRIDDVTAVAALRSLRERAIADAEADPASFHGVIAIRSSDETYFMSMRDELPFVGSDGRWQPGP